MINKQAMIARATKQENTKNHTDRPAFVFKSAYCSNCCLTPFGTNNKAADANNNINPANANKT